MPRFDVVVVGSYVQDHCWQTARFPAPGESRIGTFSTGAGGKGFNQAIAAHRQGARTLFLGALGDDAMALNAKRFAADDGLAADWEIRSDTSTAASSIVVDGEGRNLICVALGANEKLSGEFVQRHQTEIAQARVLVCQLECNLEATRLALDLACRGGVQSILNPAPINPGIAMDLIHAAAIITPNETEFAYLMQQCFASALPARYWQLPAAELHALCRLSGVGTVVITLGEQGCFVSHADGDHRGDAEACYALPAEAVTVIDTTGAGDAFNGGLAAGLLRYAGLPFRLAVQHANRVAALAVEKSGTAPAMPDFAAVRARFGDLLPSSSAQ